MSARSRRKGVAFERSIARRFREIGIDAERNLEEVRHGNSGDIVLPASVPLTVQVKCGARPNPYQALREAREAAEPTKRFVVAIVHMDGVGPRKAVEMACMPLDDFFEIVGLLKAGGVW